MCATNTSGTYSLDFFYDWHYCMNVQMDKFFTLFGTMFSYSFPPVDDFVRFMKSQNWAMRYNQFMDFVVTMCAFIAVIVTILHDTWVQYDCTQRSINGWNLVKKIAKEIFQFLLIAYEYTRQTLIPNAIKVYQDSVSVYSYLRGDYLAQ